MSEGLLEQPILCGFVGALPFAAAGQFYFQERRWTWLWETATATIAFSAYYWLGAAVLWVR